MVGYKKTLRKNQHKTYKIKKRLLTQKCKNRRDKIRLSKRFKNKKKLLKLSNRICTLKRTLKKLKNEYKLLKIKSEKQ
mgnify:CR=1 FL=1